MACDPVGDDPGLAEAFRGLDFVVVQELFLTATAGLADVVLPAQSFLEREGTLTSGERRVQRFYPAVPAQGDALPDWKIVSRVGEALGILLDGRSAAAILASIAASVPDYAGLSYPSLAHTKEQWPPVGGDDLYFGGTAYKNGLGLGIQVPRTLELSSLPAEASGRSPTQSGSAGISLVPITRLYDQAITLRPSTLLRGRMAHAQIELHPRDAERLGLPEGAMLGFAWQGSTQEIQVRMSPDVPPGLALLPRSTGLSLDEPVTAPLPQAESRR
jgi:NADH-quinone oxidoreductase subunit G